MSRESCADKLQQLVEIRGSQTEGFRSWFETLQSAHRSKPNHSRRAGQRTHASNKRAPLTRGIETAENRRWRCV